jgi:hypothetical protein
MRLIKIDKVNIIKKKKPATFSDLKMRINGVITHLRHEPSPTTLDLGPCIVDLGSYRLDRG